MATEFVDDIVGRIYPAVIGEFPVNPCQALYVAENTFMN